MKTRHSAEQIVAKLREADGKASGHRIVTKTDWKAEETGCGSLIRR